MDPIPRIHHLQVDIKKDRDKIQYLERQIDGVKSQLSGHQEIFARNLGGLDFGSTLSGKLYASFNVKTNVLADYCERRKIVAELHPVFAFFQEAEITVGEAIDIPITHEFDRYDFVKDIGVARLMRDKQTKDLVAVKYIERGDTIDENLKTEIIEHRSLRHPNIVRFKEVILTPTHLAIVMEYASRGELHDIVSNEGCFPENKARHLFRQLIHGVSYCHSMQVRHRDLKLENILLDESSESLLKICYFGYPKSSVLSSQQNSRVGRPAYVPPEVIINKEYDGKAADVLSCGVTLYEMLVGAYPFKTYSKKPKHFREAIRGISDVRYSFPKDVNISKECRDLISRILVQDPAQRITISAIKKHEWFREKLPVDLVDEEATCDQSEKPTQSLEVIMHIISEAKTPIQTNRT